MAKNLRMNLCIIYNMQKQVYRNFQITKTHVYVHVHADAATQPPYTMSHTTPAHMYVGPLQAGGTHMHAHKI